MRAKVLLAGFALLLCGFALCISHAQSVQCSGSFGGYGGKVLANSAGCPSGGGGSPTWNISPSGQAPIQAIQFGNNTATFNVTLQSVPISTDVIVVYVGSQQDFSNAPFGTLSVNSVSATQVQAPAGTGSQGLIYQISGITTASLSIVVTTASGAFSDVGVVVGFLHGLSSSTATSTTNTSAAGPDPQCLGIAGTCATNTVTVPSLGIGMAGFNVNDFQPSPTITGLTVDVNISETTVQDYQIIVGHAPSAGVFNPQYSGYAFNAPSIQASWWR